MEIQKIRIADINRAIYNPRKNLTPESTGFKSLDQSIKTFGLVLPLVFNLRNSTLISGHQRLSVLEAQGATEVEVSVVDLSLEKEKALNLRLNRFDTDFDDEKLAVLLKELSDVPDLDMGVTGFEEAEISKIFDRQEDLADDDNFDADAAAEAIVEPVTKRGDLIELGPHRILCGDSSDPEDLKKVMAGQKANLLDCDFPYNVNYMGGLRPSTETRPKASRKWDKIYSDNMPQDEYEVWMRKVFTNIKEVLLPGAVIYCWQGHRQFPPMYQVLLDLGFYVSCVICWEKESAAISYANYSFQTEQCLYGWLEGAAHFWAGPPGTSNLWKISRDHPTTDYIHPTQKPVELAQRAIKNSSKRDDIVLDTFLGSGSVLISATTLGRRCFGLEIDPKYCDGIIRRYAALVGKDNLSADIKERYFKEA